VHWPDSSGLLKAGDDHYFYKGWSADELVETYAAFNPHATFRLNRGLEKDKGGRPSKTASTDGSSFQDNGVTTYLLHDFDLAGFKIVKTLREGTRMAGGTDVVELGLRGDDISGLDSEPVEYGQRKDPREYLAECGASGEEQNFLVEGQHGKAWFGRRVEINSMTSDQLIAWLEKKLKEHGIKKVIPKNETLITAYHRARYLQELKTQIEEWKAEDKRDSAPKGLRKRVEKILAKDPAISWDDAIWTCADEDLDKEEEEP
jgi:hypothetical protein